VFYGHCLCLTRILMLLHIVRCGAPVSTWCSASAIPCWVVDLLRSLRTGARSWVDDCASMSHLQAETRSARESLSAASSSPRRNWVLATPWFGGQLIVMRGKGWIGGNYIAFFQNGCQCAIRRSARKCNDRYPWRAFYHCTWPAKLGRVSIIEDALLAAPASCLQSSGWHLD
jgi:hypothetical protein